MSTYVHIHVCFSCSENDHPAAVAKKHLDLGVDHQEARWFLESLAERTGTNPGPNNGLSLWGIVADRMFADEFVDALRPFWRELLCSDPEDVVYSTKHILVFTEREQQSHSTAYEIYLEEDRLGKLQLVVKNYQCPFIWNTLV